MKKLILSALFSVLFMGGAFAQFRFQNDVNIGMKSDAVNFLDKDTLVIHFNTTKANSAWAKSKKAATLGKDSISIQKCTTARGIQCLIYTDNTLTTSVQNDNFKGGAYNGNGNPVHVESIDSLLKIMTKSAATIYSSGTTIDLVNSPTINGSPKDSLTTPSHCVFDMGSEKVFGVYPGKYKHLEYGYYFGMAGKTVTDDMTFKIGTYNNGTSGKTAKYELTVYASTSTISSFSQIGTTTNDGTNLVVRVADFYVTGSGTQTVNLSTVCGKTPNFFTNKNVYIFLKTLGTANDLSVVDGLPNATTGATHIPIVYDPIIFFDDFSVMYSSPSFSVPTATAATSVYVNYNNGVPVVKATDAALSNPGTATPVITGVTTPISVLLKSVNRVGTFTIKENLIHSTFFTVDAATAFKSNDGIGNYTVETLSTLTSDANSLWTLTVPAPISSINDDLQFTFNVNRPTDGNSTLRLEISNGSARFWYDFLFTASPTTALDGKSISPLGISTSNSSISIINAKEVIDIYTISGQKVARLSVINAMNGIAVNAGAYIIKHGNEIHKVLVK